MNILITGSNGFIGSNIAIFLKKKNINVYGIGLKNVYNYNLKKKNIYKKNIIGKVTVSNLKKFKVKFDYIIHCAGSGYIGLNKTEDFKKNVYSTKKLLEFVFKFSNRTKNIIISSTSVYGNSSKKLTEQTKINPISIYALNKRQSELVCKNIYKKYKTNIIILRVTSIYGIGLRKQFIYDACRKIKLNKNIFLGSGEELRDWLHIDDFSTLIYILIKKNLSGFNIFNCGTGKEHKIKNVLKKMIYKFKKDLKPKFDMFGVNFNQRSNVTSINKIKKLGWKPKINFDKAINDYIKWFKKSYLN